MRSICVFPINRISCLSFSLYDRLFEQKIPTSFDGDISSSCSNNVTDSLLEYNQSFEQILKNENSWESKLTDKIRKFYEKFFC
jgi:hypothetical protein